MSFRVAWTIESQKRKKRKERKEKKRKGPVEMQCLRREERMDCWAVEGGALKLVGWQLLLDKLISPYFLPELQDNLPSVKSKLKGPFPCFDLAGWLCQPTVPGTLAGLASESLVYPWSVLDSGLKEESATRAGLS